MSFPAASSPTRPPGRRISSEPRARPWCPSLLSRVRRRPSLRRRSTLGLERGSCSLLWRGDGEEARGAVN
jgi:hypothetical protein